LVASLAALAALAVLAEPEVLEPSWAGLEEVPLEVLPAAMAQLPVALAEPEASQTFSVDLEEALLAAPVVPVVLVASQTS
jgi:hypothetical protein